MDASEHPEPRHQGRIYDSILETIGHTPLIRLSRFGRAHDCCAQLLGKVEFFNPLASVKDRIGLAMIEAGERDGRIKPGTVLVEPTSGNTGIALAFVCAAKGYRLILTMPESMSVERRKMLQLLGAELELTPAADGMRGAIDRARVLVQSLPNAYMPQQFDNPANPDMHHRTTAEEIWQDTDGAVDAVVCGVGTGGTLTGIATGLKGRKPSVRMIAVEPEDSPVLRGGRAGGHKIQGIGAGFVPANLHMNRVDEILSIASETAFAMARQIARLEGLPVGISSGAALAAAVEVAARPAMKDRVVVVILPSCAERYLSTELFELLP